MTPAAQESRRPVVLLLEDEAALATALRLNLEEEFEVEVAANADEAALLLGTRSYDAILADHMMPGPKQGLDFLVEAFRLQPGARRILMTGYMNSELLTRAGTVGRLSALLLKPATAEQIRKALHDALGLSA